MSVRWFVSNVAVVLFAVVSVIYGLNSRAKRRSAGITTIALFIFVLFGIGESLYFGYKPERANQLSSTLKNEGIERICQSVYNGKVYGWTYSDGGEGNGLFPFGSTEEDFSRAKVLRSEDFRENPYTVALFPIICQALFGDVVVGWLEKKDSKKMVPFLLPHTLFVDGKETDLRIDKGDRVTFGLAAINKPDGSNQYKIFIVRVHNHKRIRQVEGEE